MNRLEARREAVFSQPAEEKEFDQVMFTRRVERLHAKILKSHEQRPDIYEFSDIYQKDELRKDAAAVAIQEKKHEANLEEKRKKSPREAEAHETSRRLSESMEILVAHFGEMYNWFGEDAYTARTTKYDDYFNGVDLVLQLGPEEDPIALTVDVTSTSDLSVIDKKIDACVKRAFSRDPNERKIKYFQSEDGKVHGALDNVIPLVIGFESMTAMDLIEKAADLDDLKSKEGKSELDRKKREALRTQITTHPAQRVMLEQMAIQLNYYLGQIEKRGGLKSDYVEKIRFVAEKINDLIMDKISDGVKNDENDIVLKRINNKIENML